MTISTRHLLTLGIAALALAACGKSEAPAPEATASEAAAPEAAAPEAQSTEWTQENPTDPAVPVNLPDTKMTNAPASEAAPATK